MDLLTADNQPIIACSTGEIGNSAIGIIRLSGFSSIEDILPALNINELKPRYASYCKIIQNQTTLDSIVATYFKAPNTYNGENILELSVHGNQLNIQKILEYFKDSFGFRSALPGEFSYRAYKNQKLNLSQVEGLDVFLGSNSNFALEQGFSLLDGELQKNYNELAEVFKRHHQY